MRCVLKSQTYRLSILFFFFISSLYQTGDVDISPESSLTTINHFAKMKNGFDLCDTREKRILSCSPNYACFNSNIFIVSQLHSPLLYYLCFFISRSFLLKAFFQGFLMAWNISVILETLLVVLISYRKERPSTACK